MITRTILSDRYAALQTWGNERVGAASYVRISYPEAMAIHVCDPYNLSIRRN